MSTPQFVATSLPKKGILKNRSSIDEPSQPAAISSSSLNRLSK